MSKMKVDPDKLLKTKSRKIEADEYMKTNDLLYFEPRSLTRKVFEG
jgi:hypothetical protein